MSANLDMKVMVAMDQSRQAEEAARYVANILPPDRTAIVLLHVIKGNPWRLWGLKKDPEFGVDVQNGLQEWERRQKKQMTGVMEKAVGYFTDAGFHPESIDIVTLEGGEGVARDIIQEAQNGYSAVVVGRTGVSQLKDLVLGGTAMKLVNKLAQVPVWVVGGDPKGQGVMVALDDSEWAMKTVDHVGMVLKDGKGSIVLFHALANKEKFQSYLDSYFPPGFEQEWLKRAREGMARVFAQATEKLLAAGVARERIKSEMLEDVSSRAGAIVAEAARKGCGTIVMGRRGLTGVEEFLIGGVSKKVVHLARDCAVWVVS